MFLKVLFAMLLVAIILLLIYAIGYTIYTHFISAKRRDIEDLRYHSDNLDYLIKKAENQHAN